MIIAVEQQVASVRQVDKTMLLDMRLGFGDDPPTSEESCVVTPALNLNQTEGQAGALFKDTSKFCGSSSVGDSALIRIDTAGRDAIEGLQITNPKLFSAISNYRILHPTAQLWEYSVGAVRSGNKEFAVLSAGTSVGDENSFFIIFSRDGENITYKEVTLSDVRKAFNIPSTASVHWSTLSYGANMPLMETGVVLDVRVHSGSQFYEIVFGVNATNSSLNLTPIFNKGDALQGSGAMGEPIKGGAYFLYPLAQQTSSTSTYGLRTYDSKSGQIYELDRVNKNGSIIWVGKSGDYAVVVRASGVDQSNVKFSYEVIDANGSILSQYTDSSPRKQTNGMQGLLSSPMNDRIQFYSVSYGKNASLAIVKEFESGYSGVPASGNGRTGLMEALLILKGQIVRVGSSTIVPEGDILGAGDMQAGIHGTFVILQFDSRLPTDQQLILNPPRQPKKTVGINLVDAK